MCECPYNTFAAVCPLEQLSGIHTQTASKIRVETRVDNFGVYKKWSLSLMGVLEGVIIFIWLK